MNAPTGRRRWGKAGVPLTPREAAAIAARAARFARINAERIAIARRRWAEGLVVPHTITAALDLRGLDGPEVDVACLAKEPDVDLWEAGKLYPTWEQLCALAELTHTGVHLFTDPARNGLADIHTSLDFHTPDPRQPAVLSYPDEVVARCPGTVLHTARNPT